MPTTPARAPSGWTTALCACILTLVPHLARGQGADSATVTTLSKVYAESQAVKGRQVYLTSCVSCHQQTEYAGEKFWGRLVGRPLGEFFNYLRTNMPQDNPASLSDEDYVNVTAYILRLNVMPAGEQLLTADSTALAKIRVARADTTRKGSPR